MPFDPIMMDESDLPLLWKALSTRDFDKAESLIASGASLDDLIEDDGNSLLHDAAQNCDLEMVDFYLNHECIQTLKQFDYIENTPLIRAAKNGNTEVILKLLSARVDPNAHNEERIGNTAIHEAVDGRHAEVVSLLLKAGANPTIPGWMGISAVDQAWDNAGDQRESTNKIRKMLHKYPSPVRDGMSKKERKKFND